MSEGQTSSTVPDLPQVVVDELARNAEKMLLPLASDPIAEGGLAVVEFEVSDVPAFFIVSVVASLAAEGVDLWIEEVSVDGQVIAQELRASEVAAGGRSTRWRLMARPGGPGSRVVARVANRGSVTAAFLGALVIAPTDDDLGI